jgi:hypothetical protein
VIIFCLVWFLSKKIIKLKFKKKRNRNRVKLTGFGSVRFFRAKTGSNQFGLVFPVLARFSRFWLSFFRFWLGFFWFGSVLARFFRFGLVLAQFFPVFSGSVWFFWFSAYKTEPNRLVFSKF